MNEFTLRLLRVEYTGALVLPIVQMPCDIHRFNVPNDDAQPNIVFTCIVTVQLQ